MTNTLRWLLVPSLVVGAASCAPDIDVDENEVGTGGPVVEFDPGNRIIPFPNNLLLDAMTGRVNVPEACNESPAAAAIREGVVNQLDGFGTFEPTLYATFSEQFDMASFTGRVVLYKRVGETGPVDATAATAIPTVSIPSLTVRYDADCMNPQMVPQMVFVPIVPLDQKSVYTVALLSGITTAEGEAYVPSFTWSLVRNEQPPVVVDANGNVTSNRTPLDPTNAEDLESLRGLALLWGAHAGALEFLSDKGHARSDILLAWEFKTQTVTDQLDPAVANSPAAQLGMPMPTNMKNLTCTFDATDCPDGINRGAAPYALCDVTDTNAECYMSFALGVIAGATGANTYTVGKATCDRVGCENIGAVYEGEMPAKQFQMLSSANIPQQWDDPIAPTMSRTENIKFLAFVPAIVKPAAGYPTVIFGHGLGSTRRSLFAIASQLATPRAQLGNATGFASIAIDFVAHDSRAVRISSDGACADMGGAPPDPTGAGAACYSPFLSPNLGQTRDNMRQSVLDLHSLRNMIEGCGATTCATGALFEGFGFDTDQVVYAGISLGGIMGSTFNSTRTDMSAAALNVPGVGWADILENTQTPQIKCLLVDGLIDAGILTGEKSSAGAGALCLTDDWKTQPGYRQFAVIGRWVLDSADPANFTSKLATKRIFIQEVMDDLVVPNIATENEAILTGLYAPGTAAAQAGCTPNPPGSPGGGGPAAPSAALLATPMANKFIQYPATLTPGLCTDLTGTDQPSAGQVFEHASLLRPAKGFCTMQTTKRCDVTAECAATMGGDTCDAASVARGQLGTLRLQTDLITFLTLNK